LTEAFKPYSDRRGLYSPNSARAAQPALKVAASR
jgi:hypothetical protein